jgi:hypothetical protein
MTPKYDIQDDERYGKIIVMREPMVFQIGGSSYVIPAGYASEGFSVPRWLWWLITPTSDKRTLVPAVKHDWLYDHHVVTRRVADRYLRDDLVRHGFPVILSYLSWAGVRVAGWYRWMIAEMI